MDAFNWRLPGGKYVPIAAKKALVAKTNLNFKGTISPD
jgi:hypothetical protein